MSQTARATLIIMTVNLTVYLIVLTAWLAKGIFPQLTEGIVGFLAFPASPDGFLMAPWTAFTYMFSHLNFVHLTVNMLWLVGFGPMTKGGWRRPVAAYLAGGVCGAAAFLASSAGQGIIAGNLAGASASVIAVVVTAACLSPDRELRLFFAANVKLKWMALAAIITIFAGSPTFTPATAAHLGGVAAGLTIGLWRRHRDRRLTDRAMEKARQHTRRLGLLNKAARSGLASLSEPERLELFALRNMNTNQR